MPKQQNALDLAGLFQAVASNLAQNQQSLNEADTYNHDHGTNMVNTFQTISKAMQQKRTAAPAAQLAHASRVLSKNQSGSARLYAEGLSKAATKFQGQRQVTPDNAMTLIQALMGAGQAPAAAAGQAQQGGTEDLLSSLLGAMGQAQAPAAGQGQQGGADDLLGALLGAAGGAQAPAAGQQDQPGIDMGDVLNAGMAFMNTKAQGGSNLEAAINALVQGSAVGSSSAHRSQSGQLVVNTLLQAIGKMGRNR